VHALDLVIEDAALGERPDAEIGALDLGSQIVSSRSSALAAVRAASGK